MRTCPCIGRCVEQVSAVAYLCWQRLACSYCARARAGADDAARQVVRPQSERSGEARARAQGTPARAAAPQEEDAHRAWQVESADQDPRQPTGSLPHGAPTHAPASTCHVSMATQSRALLQAGARLRCCFNGGRLPCILCTSRLCAARLHTLRAQVRTPNCAYEIRLWMCRCSSRIIWRLQTFRRQQCSEIYSNRSGWTSCPRSRTNTYE